MAEMTRVALDAMGGDNAPVEMVKGAVDAVNKEQNVTVLLVGKEEIVQEELGKYSYDKERIQVVGATEVIETAEPPVNAIRKKKDSSIVVGMKLVKKGEADAFVSAGSSGAILVGVSMAQCVRSSGRMEICFRMDILSFREICSI